MRIHSSSLAAIPLSLRKTQAEEIARVAEIPVTDQFTTGKQAEEKKQEQVLKPQTPAEIEQVLEKETQSIKNASALVDSTNKPANSRAMQALNAYAAQDTILKQNHRTNLIVGVDFYV